ncbi:autophagy-related protein 2 isoform X2 [Elaeis guineensis]|uniref:Autophagy-related protein 2 n=1 Tax=Elaeis guineensis var. tenera TaxID=51953 RepID=A0A6I9QKB1_ELAGV|nr:autophagy-related protein 2 isoform X2 [Elaeis guineensis]
MFSRWDFLRSTAIKRVCKFLLKKKLGEFILGDIDLDQLDVQLRTGTIHLSDLALNVDFLNQKLAGAAVLVKEGSIKSLSIKIPWKPKNCRIEVEVLEVVLAPSVQSNTSAMDADSLMPTCDKEQHMCIDSEKIELRAVKEKSSAISRDVHEGVKTIAKIVKWFLTSFHVRINESFVAFDPPSDVEDRRSAFHKSLVLRIKEIEFGTCVCEDAVAKLTNFVKFQEAVIEFLLLEDVDNSPHLHAGSEMGFSETYSGKSTITILTGPSGGFSGTLNLSIPWENGSLDIRKVDADVSVDSVELKVQPSSINWLIAIWESLKNIGTARRSNIYKATDSPDHKCRFDSCSSTSGSAIPDSEKVTPGGGSHSNDPFLTINQDSASDALLTRMHLIHNWVPESFDLKDRTDLEPDYGASIDEFFECFDGMRSYEANSGTSGIWNWTCSVFSAISVASNLASGSGHVPIEQNVETSLRATIAEISVVLSFIDEDQTQSYDSGDVLDSLLHGQSSDSYMSCHSSMNIEQSALSEVNSMKIHHLEARGQHLALDLQTYPQIMKFGASLKHIKVDVYYDGRNCAEAFNFHDYKNDSYYQMLLNQHLQARVQGALPPYPFSAQDHDSESSVTNCRNGLIKVTLLESFDLCSCRCSINSTGLDGKQLASTFFSVHLPPFVLWVHFPLVNMLLNLFKQVEHSFTESSMNKDSATNVLAERHNSSFLEDAECGSISYLTTGSQRASLQGNMVLSQARVILCFPSENYGDFRHSASLDKFIVLEHSSSVGDVSDFLQLPKESSPKVAYCTPFTSVHLHLGDLDIYFVKSSSEISLVDGPHALEKKPFSAVKILSVTNGLNDYHLGITILWQKGPVTGPWMARRTWSLSKSHDQGRKKVVGKGAEYSSVTTAEDLEGTSSSIRQELILSSAFLFHVKFSCVCINLCSHDYKLLNQLLNYALDGLSSRACGTDTNYEGIRNGRSSPNDCYASQASVHVECDLLDICITLDEVVEVSHLIQKELQGSWECLKLKVKKFELLSASNIGGISKANFSWLTHGEGELRGSILSRNEKASEVTEDLVLITCKNSAIRRGDGDGTNVLSFTPAGTTVTHIWNPESCQSYTSVIVRGATVVAPGGRLDWINAICLYFSLPSQENEQAGNGKASVNDAASETLLFLDLVDIALSYEPHIKDPRGANGVFDREHSCSTESNVDREREYVACLLAASSFSLSNHTKANSSAVNYNIQLQDAGLLICESSGTRNGSGGYHVGCLQEIGYVKVAQIVLVEVILRIKGLLWEIECSESHINLDTCHDTAYGLVHLVAQLQQLYAPDVEDSLMYLQYRWNTIQQAQEDHSSNDVADNSESTAVGLGFENSLPTSDEDCVSVGLLDEIIENAFYINGEYKSPSGHCNIQSYVSLDEYVLGDKLNINNSMASDASPLIFPKDGSFYGSGTGNTQQPSMHKPGSPQLIESYYASGLLQSSTLIAGHHSAKEDHKCKSDNTTRKDMESGKGGWYEDSSLMIVENHLSKIFSQPEGNQHKEGEFTSSNSSPAEYYIVKGRVLLKNIDVRWRMYSGLDWIKPSKNSYNSLNGRDGSVCLEFTLSGLNLQYDMYPDGEICVSKLSVSAQDFHLYDMSRDAPWKMVLGYYHSKDHPRESCAKAFKLDLEAVRPDPSAPLEEYRLHLEFLPMRLHLYQDQLNFLIGFFGKDSFVDEPPSLPNNLSESVTSGRKSRSFGSQTIMEEALLPFFQKCVVRPFVVRVDYIPRHFDPAALRKGNYAELLNLVAWKGIDLHLKRVCAVGVYGWSSICETVLGEWLEDISHNQVHKLLKGLAPIRSLFAVSSGTSKLVSFPIKSYRKDHKLLKGIQRDTLFAGAIAFIRSISIEAVGLGVHLAAGAHEILLQTEYILTSIPSSGLLSETNRRKCNIRSNQPEDAQQGIWQAYESLSDGLSRTASALLGTPLKAYQRGAGAGSALATAFRAAPAAAVAPVSASARAVHCTLLGLRNSLDPEHKKESMGKYLGSSPS